MLLFQSEPVLQSVAQTEPFVQSEPVLDAAEHSEPILEAELQLDFPGIEFAPSVDNVE